MTLIDRFKQHYQDFDQYSIDELDQLYEQNIVFSDPIHQIEGLQKLKQYFADMCGNLTSCRFEFINETVTPESAWFKWLMRYQHPKLQNGKSLQLTGATHICYHDTEGKILLHEDFYDMGSMLYEHTPVLGGGVRWLKQQLKKAV